MHNRVSPAQSAKRVLQAFPYAHAGAEISSGHVAEHFRRNGYAVSDMVAGIHYAASSGWVERTDVQGVRLTLEGITALGKQTPVPASTFGTWAHP